MSAERKRDRAQTYQAIAVFNRQVWIFAEEGIQVHVEISRPALKLIHDSRYLERDEHAVDNKGGDILVWKRYDQS